MSLTLQNRPKRKNLRQSVVVRRSPRDPSKAILRYGPLVIRGALGRGGIGIFKREGDGVTPRASMLILGGFRRVGLLVADKAGLPLKRVGPRDGWCDAPDHACYNRPVRLPFCKSHEVLLRNDVLYDFGFVLDWNISSRRRGLGSAIFLHVAKPDYPVTQGCVAVSRRDMLVLMPHLKRGTIVEVHT